MPGLQQNPRQERLDVGIKLKLMALVPAVVQRRVMLRHYRNEVDHNGEPELMYLRHLLKRGDLTLDIGAHLGTYTAELARVTGHVVAFEPNPGLAHLLRRQKMAGVTVEEAAVGAVPGNADLIVPRRHNGHGFASLKRSVAEAAGDRLDHCRVKVVTLDELDLAPVAFIKIDVEGLEEEVLSGATGLIERDSPIVLAEIEERHSPGGLARVTCFFENRGYAGFFMRSGAWRAVSEFDLVRDQDYLASRHPGVTERTANYCNNFLFLPLGIRPDFIEGGAGEQVSKH